MPGMHPLVAVLRAHLARRRLPRLPPGIGAVARRHRVAGTLYHIGASLSDLDAQICRAAWADACGAHLLRMEALCRIWPGDLPEPLIFKGADLAENVYGDPGARAARDLDLIVPPGVFEAAVARLRPLADAVRWPRYERLPGDRPYAVGLVIGELLIELHAHPMPPHRGGPHGAALWARSERWPLDGAALRRPAPLDRWLLWLCNQAKGAFFGDLGDLLDGAMILRALDAPLATLDAVAEAHGLRPAWRLARRRLGPIWPAVALPDGGLARLLPPVGADPIEPPPLRFQALKWALMPPEGRWPAFKRGLYSQLSGTKTMSPG